MKQGVFGRDRKRGGSGRKTYRVPDPIELNTVVG